MKSRFSFSLLVIVNVFSLGLFFLPLFVKVDSEALQDLLPPVAIGLVTLSAFSCIALSHSRMTSRSLITLSAIASALGVLGRLLDLPAGGSGMFFVVIVCGIALGSNFGQLVGMSSMLISAVITGAIGPWLGYQTIAMGLVGAASGLVSPIATRSIKKDGVIGNPSFAVLIIVSGLLGLLYGFLVNWWSWPFLDYGNGISYDQTSSIVSNVSNYFRFYIRTSLWWDIWALLGNSIAMVLFGRHVIMALLPAREFLYPKIEFLEAEEITDQRVSN